MHGKESVGKPMDYRKSIDTRKLAEDAFGTAKTAFRPQSFANATEQKNEAAVARDSTGVGNS